MQKLKIVLLIYFKYSRLFISTESVTKNPTGYLEVDKPKNKAPDYTVKEKEKKVIIMIKKPEHTDCIPNNLIPSLNNLNSKSKKKVLREFLKMET